MKKLTLIFTLLFTVLLSAPSYAEWTKVSETVNRDTVYVDFERIRKHDGYVYFWTMTNLFKRNLHGDMSAQHYSETDCKRFQWRTLYYSWHTEPFLKGEGFPTEIKYPKWLFPTPDSSNETILKNVCNHAKTIKPSD